MIDHSEMKTSIYDGLLKFRQIVKDDRGNFSYWHYWGYNKYRAFVPPFTGDSAGNSYQYVGIKIVGRNEEIYEGDIVMVINYLNGKRWKGHCHPCVVDAVPGGWDLKYKWMHESLQSSEIELIGNIIENPELLESIAK